MPRPTPMPVLQVVFARMQLDRSASQIACEFGVSQRTIEDLLTRFRS